MRRRRLPIGIQTLRKIREDGCYYVDKTADIARLIDGGAHYFLPNLEVRQSLNEHLLRRLHPDTAHVDQNQSDLHRLLEANDIAGLERLFHSFFAGIPHQWHTNNDTAGYEGYYAGVFYSYFAALGLDVTVEESSSRGRLDMAARAGGRVYLFEFKVVEQAGPGAALAQLKQRRYADRYRSGREPVHLVGVEFSSADRNIERFDTEEA